MSGTILFDLTEQRKRALSGLKDRTGLSMSELLRRIVDYSLVDHRLNEIIPAMSGGGFLNAQPSKGAK